MIYDFCFHNTSKDSAFFLHILRLNSSLGNHSHNAKAPLHCGARSSAPHSQGFSVAQSNTANTRIVESEIQESQANSESTASDSCSVIASAAKQSIKIDSKKVDCHDFALAKSRNDRDSESPTDSEPTPAVGHSPTAIESSFSSEQSLEQALKASSGWGIVKGEGATSQFKPLPLNKKENTESKEVNQALEVKSGDSERVDSESEILKIQEAKAGDSKAIDSESEKQTESTPSVIASNAKQSIKIDSETMDCHAGLTPARNDDRLDSESVDCHEAIAPRNDNTHTATESHNNNNHANKPTHNNPKSTDNATPLHIFIYTHGTTTHCLLPDYAALLESCTNSYPTTQTSPARAYLSAHATQDSARIAEFATRLSSALPLSLHFHFDTLSPITPSASFYALLESFTESLPPFESLLPHALDCAPDTPITPISRLPHPEPKTHYYSAQEIQSILESKDSSRLNAASSAHKPLALPDSQYFAQVVRALQNNERVCFDTKRGAQILSLTPSEGALTLLCDISSLKTYFRCHKAQIDALASFEKPLTHLIPKEVFASLFPQGRDSLVRLCLPYDMPLALLGALLLQEDIGYFFATPALDSLESRAPANPSADSSPNADSNTKASCSAHDSIASRDLDSQASKSHAAKSHAPATPAPFCFHHSPASAPQILTISNDGILLDTAIASGQDFASLLRAHALDSESRVPSTPAKRANPARQLVIYLSTRHNSAFWLKEGESHRVLLPIEFEASPLHIVQSIARSYKSGDELLKNFQAKAPTLLSRIFALDSAPSPSQNLMDMLSIAAFVLGFSDTHMGLDSKQELFRRAYGFVRERGPRIDYTLLREGSALKLDYPRVVRSLLSFKCAGVEDEFLAYGVIDSLCEFVATLVRDSVVNLSVDNVLLLGDFLASHIVLDRLLGYLPKHISLTLPKEGWLDY